MYSVNCRIVSMLLFIHFIRIISCILHNVMVSGSCVDLKVIVMAVQFSNESF